MIKRIFDIGFAIICLVAAGPLMLALAATIKATSPGPVFYRGVRVGRNGNAFRIFKFRSMVVDAEKLGGASTANGDKRITSVGGLMRSYKLDELPQLFNVLNGTMSFVGPRPEVQQYVDMYTENEKIILKLRPGVTDWASIWNSDEGAVLAGADDPDQAYLEVIRPTKLKLQILYANSSSLGVDLKIIACTALKLAHIKVSPRELEGFEQPIPVSSYKRQAAA